MPRIHRLGADVVNKIAAGEVIERPASVVKELLENSTDALATRIEVDVARGGAEMIRVLDDGEGIAPEDLPLAVASHSTSKLASADDLFRVRTMGFRGEALASIAAVSRLRIRSRTQGSATGYQIELEGGIPPGAAGGLAGAAGGLCEPCGCPAGTLVEVRQLFHNTPVRRKFLRTPGTEFGHISEQFARVVLPRPRLQAVLRHNGKTVYELPPTGELIERLRMFYGRELAESLIPVDSQTDNVRLWGYAAHPSQSKTSRKGQYLFLNGRPIQDRSLQHALGEAYRGLLMSGRYPIAFLFLEMPPEMVDVNVHPTKAEVRFRDGQQLYRQLLSTLRTKFLGMDLGSPLSLPKQPPPVPQEPPDPAYRAAVQQELADWAKEQLANWTPPENEREEPSAERHSDHGRTTQVEERGGLPGAAQDGPLPSSGAPSAGGRHQLVGAPKNPSAYADGSPGSPDAAPRRAVQMLDCYLVLEADDGITLIDQHALHERVVYEQLRARVLEGTVESQKMLVPETVELGTREASLLAEHSELLGELGFGIEEFGGNTVLLTAYPAILRRADHGRLLCDLAEHLDEHGQSPHRRDILDRLLHTMACKAAVKAGDRLKPEEIDALLGQRHLIDDAHHCPHGRPTSLTLTRAELDRQFGRLG